MARSVTEIKSAIQVTIRTFPSFDNYKFPDEPGGSQASRFNSIIHAIAVAINVFEVLLDTFNRDVQVLIDSVPVHNTGHTRQKILNFQFGDVISLDSNFVPSYTTIDESKKIVTQCAVVDSDTDLLTIKVAKGTSPSLGPLTGPELTALQEYFLGTATTQGVGAAGVNVLWVNAEGDKLYLEGDIFYFGQFDSSVVKTNVITAINSYLESFQNDNFNGELFMNKLVDAIQEVEGVSRVNFGVVRGRPDAIVFPGGTVVDPQGTYKSVAGYIVEETEAGNTFNDSLTMVLETLGT